VHEEESPIHNGRELHNEMSGISKEIPDAGFATTFVPHPHRAIVMSSTTAGDSSCNSIEITATNLLSHASPILDAKNTGIATTHHDLSTNHLTPLLFNNTEDIAEHAAIMFLEEQMSAYTQQRPHASPEALPSLISQAVFMTQDELDNLCDKIEERVHGLVAILRRDFIHAKIHHVDETTIDPSLLQPTQHLQQAFQLDLLSDTDLTARDPILTPISDQRARHDEEPSLLDDQTMRNRDDNDYENWFETVTVPSTPPGFSEPSKLVQKNEVKTIVLTLC
jgi:hypothetical protein